MRDMDLEASVNFLERAYVAIETKSTPDYIERVLVHPEFVNADLRRVLPRIEYCVEYGKDGTKTEYYDSFDDFNHHEGKPRKSQTDTPYPLWDELVKQLNLRDIQVISMRDYRRILQQTNPDANRPQILPNANHPYIPPEGLGRDLEAQIAQIDEALNGIPTRILGKQIGFTAKLD